MKTTTKTLLGYVSCGILLAGVVLVLACGVAKGAEETTDAWGKAEEVVFPRVEFERATVADVME